MMTSIWAFALAFWMFWFPQLVVRVPGPGGAVPAVSVVPAFVQSNGGFGMAGSTGLAYSGSVTHGNALYVLLFDGNSAGDTLAFSDSEGNSWSTIATRNLNGDGDTMGIGCALVSASTGADTVKWTINGSGAPTANNVSIYEVSNSTCTTDTTSVTDNNTGGPGTSVPCSVGPITTVTTNDLLLTACGGSHNGSWALGSGWSHLQSDNGASSAEELEMQVGTTASGYTGTSTETIGSNTWEYAGIIVAFKHL